jgi:uncharacterized protein YkwD
LWNPFGGCSSSFVSPEYAAKPVEPLDPEAALEAINAYRAENGRKPLVLDERLARAAAAQSEAQAGRSRIVAPVIGSNQQFLDAISAQPAPNRCRRSGRLPSGCSPITC